MITRAIDAISEPRLALRINASKGEIERLLILLAPIDNEIALRRSIGAYTRLGTIIEDSIEIPVTRAEHDGFIESFPLYRHHLATPGYVQRSCWFACRFHIYTFLDNLIDEADTLGYDLHYQVNLQSLVVNPENLRDARKNLAGVRRLEGVPPTVIHQQEECVNALHNAVAVVDEYIATSTPDAVDWLQTSMAKLFTRTFGRLNFDLPDFSFVEGSYEDFVVTGLHRMSVSNLSTEDICNTCINLEQQEAILTWSPDMKVVPEPVGVGGVDLINLSGVSTDWGISETELPIYDGNQDFIFVSYKREDFDRIRDTLQKVVGGGYRIWFDKGILGGSEWDEEIERKIEGCKLLIAFISKLAVNSKYVRREVKFADALDKPILSVFLEPTELARGMKLLLRQFQNLDVNAGDFPFQLKKALDHHLMGGR